MFALNHLLTHTIIYNYIRKTCIHVAWKLVLTHVTVLQIYLVFQIKDIRSDTEEGNSSGEKIEDEINRNSDTNAGDINCRNDTKNGFVYNNDIKWRHSSRVENPMDSFLIRNKWEKSLGRSIGSVEATLFAVEPKN